MANTYTSNLKLAMPSLGDTGWAVPVNGNTSAIDGLSPVGSLAVTTAEVPSASLNVAVSSGTMVNSSGSYIAYAGTPTTAMTASSTTYLWLTDLGVLASGTAWPASGTQHVRLAKVVAGASTITSVTDQRAVLRSASS